ncbi:Crp/Fnr family transcriptional regulator [Dyadobacter fermentans]|uniref:Putative transcriptional regulator, Crp/Fnr family n=1 Tax=Dyadobacter fermentans (strain ATCC 700827 / DSM 18053 / CIP 107007 / KCTC 52180 / NS114) TaxID=471854 RepID=C6W508_DYAFD|nr:Crp/Fnr family transcriptional regulator [Dyadobacter fermentans]ACT92368.1 putative transcriptional regulator, Crp/Fnr family [Dyadobacter fermentans DSM 18053]
MFTNFKAILICMTDLENYLQTYFEFDQSDLAKVASFFKPEMLRKGDYYLKTGKPCNKLSFIKSGLLRIYVDLEDREVTQWICTQGYFVTDLSSLVFAKPARWNIQALTDTFLYTIDKEDYDRIGDYIPKWPVTEKLFIAHCFTTLEDRVFSFLSMTAEQRYNLLFESHRDIFTQVPLQYIASMLGMTPETISRIRRKQLS